MWQLIVPYRTESYVQATIGPDHLLSFLLSIDQKIVTKMIISIIIRYNDNYYKLDIISVYDQGLM